MGDVVDIGIFTASALGSGMLFRWIAEGMGAIVALFWSVVRRM